MGKCIYENCNKRANFNYINEAKALYCNAHKLDNMININTKKCIEYNCIVQPSFNYSTETSYLYCYKHKKENMIDIRNIRKQCIYDKCTTRAVFNYLGETKAIYCTIHKKENMIDIKSKKCIENNCNLQPSYNYANQTHAIYCSNHKKDRMIDIKHSKCQYSNCTIIASYNYINNNYPIYCNKHKKENMVDIRAPKCNELSCMIYPSYNYENNKKPVYCKLHKKDDMIDVINKRCNTLLCDTIVSNKNYDGYCFYCYYNLFPDSEHLRNFKTKEKSISEYLLNKYKDKTIIIDRPIYDGCSKRRPDIFIDLGYQVIIVEIDENQHSTYNSICENKRLMQISQDINHRPLIMIRFNPDKYVNIDNKIVTSPWVLNKRGIYTINKNKQKEWDQRLDILKSTIDKYINDIYSVKTVEIVHLFYNNYT